MSNPNPSPKNRFQKGVCQNPGGKPALPKHLAKIKGISAEELKRTISMYFRMYKDELAGVLQNPKTPALDLIIVSAIAKSIKEGDLHRAEYLFLRTIGRVKDIIEVNEFNENAKVIIQIPSNSRENDEI